MAYLITIRKSNVLYHAMADIQKVLDVRGQTGTQAGYHVNPDQDNRIDKELLHRCMELRDADVNTILQKHLSNFSTEEIDDLHDSETDFQYSLEMPDAWPSTMLRPLATYIHNYLVKGILYDYLKDKMPDIAETYKPDVDSLKESVETALNTRQGFIKRPLQPF